MLSPVHAPHVVLLGPQRFDPTVGEEVRALAIEGGVATITAGWQEREAEVDELHEVLGDRGVNLELHRRSERVWRQDKALFEGHRKRQDQLRRLQEIYRRRLSFYMDAVRDLRVHRAPAALLAREQASALEVVRELEAQHEAHIRDIHGEFENRWHPDRRPAVQRQRDELAAILARCGAVAIAGGHVGVLLNRLRLFGMSELLRGKPVLCWSAGAMALAERVVIFHDHPPQGAGDSELFDLGLGLFPDLVPLPHAKRRLRLDDRDRVAALAQRFAPAVCVALDEGVRLYWNGRSWRSAGNARTLGVDGEVGETHFDGAMPP